MSVNVIDYIPSGEENAIPMKDLARITGMQERDVRKAVFNERVSGAVIAGTNSGYYVPITDAELRSYYKLAKSRALSTLRSLKAARLELKRRGIDCDSRGKKGRTKTNEEASEQ